MAFRELVRTNDGVLLSFIEATLKSVGIRYIMADRHMSAVEGSIGVFPRRVLVAEADVRAAVLALTDAGLEHELVDEVRRPESHPPVQAASWWGWLWRKS
jgi:hypothetical protein